MLSSIKRIANLGNQIIRQSTYNINFLSAFKHPWTVYHTMLSNSFKFYSTVSSTHFLNSNYTAEAFNFSWIDDSWKN